MSNLTLHKVNSLPAVLDSDAVYAVKEATSNCFELIITDSLGNAIPSKSQPVFASLSADFDINSTTLVPVPDLTFPVLAGERWVFTLRLFTVSLNAAADLRGNTTGPVGSAGMYSMLNTENATVKSGAINTPVTNINVATSTGINSDLIEFKGWIEAAANGNVGFELRNNSGTTVQTFAEGSYLQAMKV